MSYDTIEFLIADSVARLTFNRPKKLNSFNVEMHEEVRSVLRKVQRDKDIRSLLITGNGRGFCAGQDLSYRNDSTDEAKPNLGTSLEKYYNPLIRMLSDLEVPVVCAVNGVAAGAGANIAFACDIVVAARSATFIQAFSRIGLIPDSGGTWQMVHSMGRARAMALAMLGSELSAEHAAEWGMIWRCVDDDKLQQEGLDLAKHLSAQPTQAMAYIKRAINRATTNSLSHQLDTERDLQELAGQTEDYLEGVHAFLEKRPAKFVGR